MELVQGIDFFDLLRCFKLWEEESARFYVSCLVLILEYLHERKVAYRDLKPENIIIDQDGYPKLIDFGLAKVIQGRTYSIAGSTHYMAPEVIKGLGYGLEADYWSLGVIIYEILCNKVPWGEYENDPMEVYNLIINGKLTLPQTLKNNHVVKLVQKLLNHTPACRGSIESIKKDVWFISISFNCLIEKNVHPPFKPDVEVYSRLIKSSIFMQKDLGKFILKYEDDRKQFEKDRNDKDWDFEF
jgi:cGMP-dependent protein kinase